MTDPADTAGATLPAWARAVEPLLAGTVGFADLGPGEGRGSLRIDATGPRIQIDAMSALHCFTFGVNSTPSGQPTPANGTNRNTQTLSNSFNKPVMSSSLYRPSIKNAFCNCNTLDFPRPW